MSGGKSSASSNLITLVLTSSHWCVYLISFICVSKNRCYILPVNAFQSLAGGSCMKLNSISIEWNAIPALFFNSAQLSVVY